MRIRDRFVWDWLLNVHNLDVKVFFTLMGLWAAYGLLRIRNSLGHLNQEILNQSISAHQLPSYWLYSLFGILYLFIWIMFPTMIHLFDPMLYLDTDNALTLRQNLSFKKQKIDLEEILKLEIAFEFVSLPISIIASFRSILDKEKYANIKFKVIRGSVNLQENRNSRVVQGEISKIAMNDLEKLVNRFGRSGFWITSELKSDGNGTYILTNQKLSI
ncbi:MAG: hypothetical protein D6732_28925 [Methanobacteriota archaeon]|nr:MAG: hypothetical protein D6732_28925 [Euryarchaeota archaeon]